jgi:RNA polymerase sigma factor (sigma-70 family)
MMRLYRDHASALSRYAASFARNQEGARDAVQEIFLRYFIQRRYGQQIENPRAWLYHVLRNYLRSEHQAGANQEVVSANLDQMASDQSGIEDHVYGTQMAREIESRLTSREYECWRLRAEGLEYLEIAQELGIQSGTVGALLSRAQKKIRSTGGNQLPPRTAVDKPCLRAGRSSRPAPQAAPAS